jgi:multicomponent Na+:H+ antiporter subunit E
MRHFLLNIGLSSAWAALMGSFDATTLAAGYAVGYVIVWAAQPALGPSAYVTGVGRAVAFFVFYLAELVWSSIQVAIDVCRPRLRMCPGVVGLPLRARTDAEITVLANLISLTPGTLSLDVSLDKRLLYVHAMDLKEGPDALRADIRDRLESRVLTLLRGEALTSDEPVDPVGA